jgi:hypothetical protein
MWSAPKKAHRSNLCEPWLRERSAAEESRGFDFEIGARAGESRFLTGLSAPFRNDKALGEG